MCAKDKRTDIERKQLGKKGFIQTLLKLFFFLGEWENGEHEKWNDPKTV